MGTFNCVMSIAMAVVAACVPLASAQEPMGTAFTYQGSLNSAGVPLNRPADFEFSLWDAGVGGNPMTQRELRDLGVFWRGDAFITRIRARYDESHFPSDFVFQETRDTQTFKVSHTVRIPWKGSGAQCAAADRYRRDLRGRQEQQSQTLARLTGWDINDIRGKVRDPSNTTPTNGSGTKWWEQIWND